MEVPFDTVNIGYSMIPLYKRLPNTNIWDLSLRQNYHGQVLNRSWPIRDERQYLLLNGTKKQFGCFTHAQMFRIFDSMVVPIVKFGAEVWGYAYSSTVERIS